MNKNTEDMHLDDQRLELENRIKNLLWTVSGDYTLEMKPDISLFLRSKSIALYDGIKQGAFARYYDKNLMGLYLICLLYTSSSSCVCQVFTLKPFFFINKEVFLFCTY